MKAEERRNYKQRERRRKVQCIIEKVVEIIVLPNFITRLLQECITEFFTSVIKLNMVKIKIIINFQGKKIRQRKEEMRRQQREYLEKKQTTAEQKRLDQLREIVRKAQEEDAKVSDK